MLIDLAFDIDAPGAYYRREFVRDFVTDAGSLVVTCQLDGTVFGPTCYAERIAPGVYHSYLMRDALSYTVWAEASDFADQQAEFNAVLALADGPDRESRRTKLLHRHNEYGYADTLAAALRYGREFVRSPDPHVLQVTYPDQIGEKWYKNGPYVRRPRGRACPEPGCVNFHFYKLKPRSA